MGSSPHTRGARRILAGAPARGGIIPAYAGSTIAGVLITGVLPDHPRIRGEHLGGAHPTPLPRGSSPHTRGAHLGAPHRRTSGRIIPAYAGSTIRAVAPVTVGQDHPRIRGEHASAKAENTPPGGSSPHTRGARRHACPLHRLRRIIPAYAGSTRKSWLRRRC